MGSVSPDPTDFAPRVSHIDHILHVRRKAAELAIITSDTSYDNARKRFRVDCTAVYRT